MCEQGGGGGYPSEEAPWTETCEAVNSKACQLAAEDGLMLEDLDEKLTAKYLDDAYQIVHPPEEGDKYDLDSEV